MVSVRPQNLDFGGSGVAWGRPPNELLSEEANSEPVCLIEAYRGLHGFCEASESGFRRFWGGLGLPGAGSRTTLFKQKCESNDSSAVLKRAPEEETIVLQIRKG